MASELLVRPTALLYDTDASFAVSEGRAGPLAGGGIAFGACELIEGVPDANIRKIVDYADLAASTDPLVRAWLERLQAPRAPFAGLSGVSIMGVVNVTPDSFSDGGRFADTQDALAQANALIDGGVDILDIGGESTRPGSDPIDVETELGRIMPVLDGLKEKRIPISVDTRRAQVMTEAAGAGAAVVNDVSALSYDAASLETVARLGVPVILMHALGDPKTMQKDPRYDDVLVEVYDYLDERVEACVAAGIDRSRIAVDPGIGFGKTLEHNLQLLRGAAVFQGLGTQVLFGVSRKRFIGTLSGEADAGRRAPGSIAAGLAAVARGVQILRVHDGPETVQALSVWSAVQDDARPGR